MSKKPFYLHPHPLLLASHLPHSPVSSTKGLFFWDEDLLLTTFHDEWACRSGLESIWSGVTISSFYRSERQAWEEKWMGKKERKKELELFTGKAEISEELYFAFSLPYFCMKGQREKERRHVREGRRIIAQQSKLNLIRKWIG
jgi:hypothetical protein